MSDGCIADPDLLCDIFPGTKLLLCNFHIWELDAKKHLSRLPAFSEIETLLKAMRFAPYEAQFDAAWSELQTRFPATVP